LNGSATTDPDEKMRSCIVSFPLEALPMGITQGELESKLTELKKLLDEN
jgi:hypothetical protein